MSQSPYAKDFALPKNEIYFNCAAQGPFTIYTSQAVAQGIRDKEAPACLDLNYVQSRLSNGRKAIAQLLNARTEDIAFANSTSWGENIIAQGMPWKEGDEVVLMDGQFPSTHLPWEMVRSRGVKVVKYSCPDFIFDIDKFKAALTSRTRVASFEWVHYVSGDRMPITEALEICKSKGIITVMDITQGFCSLPFDWKKYPVDALCCSGYKWMLSPYGTGFFAITQNLADQLNLPYANWLALEDVAQGRLTSFGLEFVKNASRFDVSSSMGFLNIDGMIASLNYLHQVGVENAFKQTQKVNAVLRNELNTKAYRFLSPGKGERESCIVTFQVPTQMDAATLCANLVKEGFHTSVRSLGTIRVAANLYNDEDQMRQLVTYLNKQV